MYRIAPITLSACALFLTLVSATAATNAGPMSIKSGVLSRPGGGEPAATATAPSSPAPCVVTLFSGYQFANFNAQYFTYTPTCPGPWGKVLFNGSFAITPGIQFDRTAEISIGYVNVYYGTTREDDPTFGPTWNVSRDLTDYSSLFLSTQPGEVDLGNLVNSQYTGIISGTATLEFYPVPAGTTAPVVADAVYPMPNGPGGAVALNSGTSQLSQTLTFPTNVERAYLDVLTESQSNDEFWWSCAPNDIAPELQDCGNTAFRETEVTIDGAPAGVAPVYPWIYTGGIDPNLWLPIPGVQTLDFVPYRVDLTPFAATLNDGQPHTVALSVFNADNYFLATAALLIYLDHGSTVVTGGVTSNTLTAAPSPVVTENISIDSNGIPVGTVKVTSQRQFLISGYVNTSHGKTTTSVTQSIDFTNLQTYTDTSNVYQQATTVKSSTSVLDGSNSSTTNTVFNYPLNVGLSISSASNGDTLETISVKQGFYNDNTTKTGSTVTNFTEDYDTFSGSDTIDLVAGVDVAQQSALLSRHHVNGMCTDMVTEAVNDSITKMNTSPCK